ncbi:Calx-beta domain-containing protein [Nocardioides iriomotensis]|uniref:Calx-beta domain-containing protein n=1 Tax=Nocardioides iriomotensis TaxID=715784 RepID=A0A4Q5IZL2_9ACTN|nr:Calx-beta domain-containing protein [Nocardioides iriomotensis]RYU10748.1 hypothetical protein ETU37_15965 [Nocardioides iriomotensis]
MSRRRQRVGALAAGSVVVCALGAPVAFAAPATTSEITGNGAWVAQAYENTATGIYLTPQQSDVEGPARAPFGSGSHRMVIGESTVQTELYRTPKYDGTPLADITRLEYSTFARRTNGAGALRQPTFLRLNVDKDGDGDQDEQLFFFPANNTDQQAVANGVWQHWVVTGSGLLNVGGDAGAGSATTLAAYKTANPAAELINNDDPADGTATTADGGSIALITGGGNGGGTDSQANGEYFVDRVVVGLDGVDTLFDLGPAAAVQTVATSGATVTPSNLQGWYHEAYDAVDYLDSNQAFVDGPGATPAGGGALRFALSTTTNPDRVELFRTTQFDGTLVRDLRTLKFSTFQRATGANTTPQQPVYLRLSVDTNGDGGMDDTLFYAPANNGTVAQSTWQSWDAASGVWGVNGDQGNGSVTLAEYVVAHPDAVIVKNAYQDRPGGGVAFLVGASGASQMNGEYFLDDVTIGSVDAATGRTSSAKRFDLDSVAPAVSVGDARVLEGNSGTVLNFPVALSRAVPRAVAVDFATVAGTATAGQDFTAASGILTIPAGANSGSITVKVASDKVREPHEALSVKLTARDYGTLGKAVGAGSILNDDTKVALELGKAAKHRVEASVKTKAPVAKATVKLFRVVKGKNVRVLKDELSKKGRLSTVLDEQFEKGTKVKLFAKVRTPHGVYVSETVRHTVR